MEKSLDRKAWLTVCEHAHICNYAADMDGQATVVALATSMYIPGHSFQGAIAAIPSFLSGNLLGWYVYDAFVFTVSQGGAESTYSRRVEMLWSGCSPDERYRIRRVKSGVLVLLILTECVRMEAPPVTS